MLSRTNKLKLKSMAEELDDNQESDVDLFNSKDPRLQTIDTMLQLLVSFSEMGIKDPYDKWDEDLVKVLSNTMQIIIKKQKEILKDK